MRIPPKTGLNIWVKFDIIELFIIELEFVILVIFAMLFVMLSIPGKIGVLNILLKGFTILGFNNVGMAPFTASTRSLRFNLLGRSKPFTFSVQNKLSDRLLHFLHLPEKGSSK